MSEARATARTDEFHDDIIYPATIPFVLVHLSAFAAIWTGVTLEAVALGITLYWVRMWAVTAGYHRYFSHRSFRTGRVFQFILAFMAQSSLQRGVIWWAAIHRHHHRHSDTEFDVHSPRHRSFLYSHVGWIFSNRDDAPDYGTVADLTAYPELAWIEKHHHIPGIVLAAVCFLIAGWPGLVVGFVWSTVLLYHGSFSINSLAHVHGRKRYVTGDDSRNNWWLSLITMGEGWHNNHHAYQSATRQGFRWYEIDATYYILRVLSWFRIVRNLRQPPAELVRNERRLGRRVVEQVAHQLAHSFPVERIAGQVRETLAHTPTFEEIRERARTAHAHAAAKLADLHLPQLPSVKEIRRRAEERFANAPQVSLDEITERARQILLERVTIRLFDGAEPLGAT